MTRSGSVGRLPRGISRTPTGWRISIRRTGRPLYQKRFPPSTPLEVVLDARARAVAGLEAGRSDALPGTIAGDVRPYLTTYFGQRPGRAERERHLRLWLEQLGADTWRHQVTREDVSRVLHGWRASGLSADTCNKRRAALLAFYNALNGKGGQNPVRDVPKFRTEPALPRGLSYGRIKKALAAMPLSRTRARLKVMAFTGARPIQIRRLTPEDWDRPGHTLLLRSTEKGHGTKPHRIPLSKHAQAAMVEFAITEAWGSFASAPMGRIWKAAAIKAGLPADTRVYDLRHSFGTEVYRTTGDLRITKELLGHASFAMTERYTLAAIPERQQIAVTAFETAVHRAKVRKLPVQKLPLAQNTKQSA